MGQLKLGFLNASTFPIKSEALTTLLSVSPVFGSRNEIVYDVDELPEDPLGGTGEIEVRSHA